MKRSNNSGFAVIAIAFGTGVLLCVCAPLTFVLAIAAIALVVVGIFKC